jgi:di/tricarboxylate transporter
MEAATTRNRGAGASVDRSAGRNAVRRLSTETKQAFKTTEFWAMVVVIVGILAAAAMIKGGDTAPGTDEFIAKQAWLYVAIVAVGYMISRGLAKSGSREPYEADRDDRDPPRH